MPPSRKQAPPALATPPWLLWWAPKAGGWRGLVEIKVPAPRKRACHERRSRDRPRRGVGTLAGPWAHRLAPTLPGLWPDAGDPACAVAEVPPSAHLLPLWATA